MGCSAGKPATSTIEKAYVDLGLPVPDGKEYENDFEKQVFMTLNVLRKQPKYFLQHIKSSTCKLFCSDLFLLEIKSEKKEELIKLLESLTYELPFIHLDQDACKACRERNDELLKDQSIEAVEGGQLAIYVKNLG